MAGTFLLLWYNECGRARDNGCDVKESHSLAQGMKENGDYAIACFDKGEEDETRRRTYTSKTVIIRKRPLRDGLAVLKGQPRV